MGSQCDWQKIPRTQWAGYAIVQGTNKPLSELMWIVLITRV